MKKYTILLLFSYLLSAQRPESPAASSSPDILYDWVFTGIEQQENDPTNTPAIDEDTLYIRGPILEYTPETPAVGIPDSDYISKE